MPRHNQLRNKWPSDAGGGRESRTKARPQAKAFSWQLVGRELLLLVLLQAMRWGLTRWGNQLSNRYQSYPWGALAVLEEAGYIIARLVDLVAVTMCALVRIIRVQAVAAEACSSGWTWLVSGRRRVWCSTVC